MKNPITQFLLHRHAKILDRAMKQARSEGRLDEFLTGLKENAELQKLVLQPKRYETVNGAGEIGWGAAMLCFAISSYAPVILPESPYRGWIGFLFLAGACAAMPLALWGSKRFVTWPRVGYVAFRRDTAWWIGIVVAVVIGGILGVTLPFLMGSDVAHATHPVTHGTPVASSPPSLTGQILKFGLGPMSALLYLMFNAVSIKEHPWKRLLLALILTVPLGICFLVPGNYIEVSRPMTLFLGLIWLASGLVTLLSFMRHHQLPAPDAK